ncbi:hypothetical protein PO909_031870 [Leuciscus waleckii]
MSFSASIWDFKINKRFEHLLFLPPRWLLLQNGRAHLSWSKSRTAELFEHNLRLGRWVKRHYKRPFHTSHYHITA